MKKYLDNSKKNPTFANENDEPTALATDVGKHIPILEDEAARRFLENARKAELAAEKRKNMPPTLEELKQEFSFKKMFLEMDRESLKTKEKELLELERKIKELEQFNGKN